MTQLFVNNAGSNIASSVSNVDTSISVTAGQGSLFPAPTGSDYFMLTLTQGNLAETSWEIVKCTSRSTDVLTVVRAQEGTTAAAWGIGDKAELRVTATGLAGDGTVDGTNAIGFRNIPINSKSAAYTLVLEDSGKVILHPSTDATARIFTIPANASVAYPLGTALTFINMTTQVVTIAITTDTMYLSSAGTTGSRSLALYGSATAIKMTNNTWLISGSGLT